MLVIYLGEKVIFALQQSKLLQSENWNQLWNVPEALGVF